MLPHDGTHRPFPCHSSAHDARCPAPPPSPCKTVQPRFCSSIIASSSPPWHWTVRAASCPPAVCRTAPRPINPHPPSSFDKRDQTKQPATSRTASSPDSDGDRQTDLSKSFFRGGWGPGGRRGQFLQKTSPPFPGKPCLTRLQACTDASLSAFPARWTAREGTKKGRDVPPLSGL